MREIQTDQTSLFLVDENGNKNYLPWQVQLCDLRMIGRRSHQFTLHCTDPELWHRLDEVHGARIDIIAGRMPGPREVYDESDKLASLIGCVEISNPRYGTITERSRLNHTRRPIRMSIDFVCAEVWWWDDAN